MKTAPLLLLCLCLCAGCGEKPATVNVNIIATYSTNAAPTYTVKTPVWETTNAIEIIPNHEPSCTLVRYVQDGKTNEFHAWSVPVVVTTNK